MPAAMAASSTWAASPGRAAAQPARNGLRGTKRRCSVLVPTRPGTNFRHARRADRSASCRAAENILQRLRGAEDARFAARRTSDLQATGRFSLVKPQGGQRGCRMRRHAGNATNGFLLALVTIVAGPAWMP